MALGSLWPNRISLVSRPLDRLKETVAAQKDEEVLYKLLIQGILVGEIHEIKKGEKYLRLDGSASSNWIKVQPLNSDLILWTQYRTKNGHVFERSKR